MSELGIDHATILTWDDETPLPGDNQITVFRYNTPLEIDEFMKPRHKENGTD